MSRVAWWSSASFLDQGVLASPGVPGVRGVRGARGARGVLIVTQLCIVDRVCSYLCLPRGGGARPRECHHPNSRHCRTLELEYDGELCPLFLALGSNLT